MKKSKKAKSLSLEIFESIRKPMAPPTTAHVNSNKKRVKKFKADSELKHY